eukprot:CAMPEP_0172182026 /NCGR_PEP_ID=MMETSP1050-20130122/18163_1 /TAXON_ID=233186 /ORGANISM="Cryptomonas curvata, Strain CCAP979/52" /LENGTH=59 /DNA_ID=CAMNT_0012855411 /DNA_START=52 /DNA_END=231 /DNA_ORIENTATION=+
MLGPEPPQAGADYVDGVTKNFDMGYQAGFIAGVQNSGFGAAKADAVSPSDDTDTVDVDA